MFKFLGGKIMVKLSARMKVPSDHLIQTRRKILNSTKTLLVNYGYKKTTIRKIAEDSGVLIGSIYYIFKNKEDIFQSMILAMVRNCIRKIEEHCPDESPAFRYAAVCALELKEMEAAPIIRDVYREGYDSAVIFEHMVHQFTMLAQHIFKDSCYETDDEIYYRNTLLIKGGMRACIGELYFEGKHDAAKSREALLDMALRLFGVPKEEREDVIARVVKQDKLWLEIANELANLPIEGGDDPDEEVGF